MSKYRFSGHDTFVVRSYWPKKGYDFIDNQGNFNSEDAVVGLGVGKNMVSSINFWLKALGLVDDNTGFPTEMAEYLLDDEVGHDPFLEDIGSIWLLHYLLVSREYSSIYYLIFNELRKERNSFTKSQLLGFIKRKCIENNDNSFNPTTIEKDLSVFHRLYKKIDFKSVTKDFEDEISSLFLGLDLISTSISENIIEGINKFEKVEWHHINGDFRPSLPSDIVFFSILDNFPDSKNISFKRLEVDPNSPGMVFLLNKDSLYKLLKEIEVKHPGVLLSETAGNIVLVLNDDFNKWDILNGYYAN